ncbi:glycosyl transferase, WecB/TagA/CpsF family [Caldicellulosiruptor acetigenus I77R1B]|uniref:Glycosyl transferase, WecB/TagA/CpsF family n=1 Tax=Caldicellulosiruptor acetigenus (strain ATCC 700853 / DSM 12137 / I77R1B) TaxID=632335 RepID=E4S7X9_CALA7|nr:WecB/TagA/CpsF family glycosyltransferase [Caldicellulosiruptor acetigenus]ADQ41879.1 glycosyl transferase, WecB/TagA/CpsF family [Caldicellulosiruptor acetigenus I77R1B]
MRTYYINGMKIHAISKTELLEMISGWAEQNEGKVICFANVHMNVESYLNSEFQRCINEKADIVCPDGMPLVWFLKKQGEKRQQRIYGPDMMLDICSKAAAKNLKIGLYGGEEEVLNILQHKLRQLFPKITIAYTFSPPFRELTEEEEEKIIADINKAGVQILFVSLGCPKQEKWMFRNKEKIKAVMCGVGAAFLFHSGKVLQAPRLIQIMGLEWLFRLLMEPRRLFKRYFKTNTIFVWLMLKDFIKKMVSDKMKVTTK